MNEPVVLREPHVILTCPGCQKLLYVPEKWAERQGVKGGEVRIACGACTDAGKWRKE